MACFVKSFLLLMLVAFISSCGQLTVPAEYTMTGRAYMLMASVLFLLSWLLSTSLNLWRYLAVADLLASSLSFLLACGIHRYSQLSCMSAMLPSGYGTAVLITFPLFAIMWPNLSSWCGSVSWCLIASPWYIPHLIMTSVMALDFSKAALSLFFLTLLLLNLNYYWNMLAIDSLG